MTLPAAPSDSRLLSTLEALLVIDALTLPTALTAATDLLTPVLTADKIDVFLYEPASDSLVAVGTSRTPTGIRQHQLGLHRMALSNGGSEVAVYQTGIPYHTGHADQDPAVLPGVIDGLGLRSLISVPLIVAGSRRGVLHAAALASAHFTPADLAFLEAVAHWVGALTHRVELVEQIQQRTTAHAREQVADELITVLAHDLGNHLTPLIGRVHLLRRRAARETRPQDLHDLTALDRGLGRLQALTRDLLDSSRLDQSLFTLEPQPLDLVALVQETVDLLQPPQGALHVAAPLELPISGDPARLRQALENLLGNALKHSPPRGAVEVTIAARWGRKRGGADLRSGTGDRAGPAAALVHALWRRDGIDGVRLGVVSGPADCRRAWRAVDGRIRTGGGACFRLTLPAPERA